MDLTLLHQLKEAGLPQSGNGKIRIGMIGTNPSVELYEPTFKEMYAIASSARYSDRWKIDLSMQCIDGHWIIFSGISHWNESLITSNWIISKSKRTALARFWLKYKI